MKKRIFSGIRATGRLHIGNYLGAVKGMLELQDNPEYEMFFAVVDVHAMTTPYDKKTLAEKTREVVLDYLAVGLDPKKSSVLVQSKVIDLHAELMFYFSTMISMARMQHLPTFKEKVKQHPENVTMALLNYPLLMAADILAYKSELVPVGIDQEPHLEVTREIARKMNDLYGTDFPEPKRFATKGEYIPSLLGQGKMSKSVEGSYINLTDDLETIKKKLASAPTDSGKADLGKGFMKDLKGSSIYISKSAIQKPVGVVASSEGFKTLMILVELFEGEGKRKECEKQYVGHGVRYSELKAELAEAIFNELKRIQEKRRELEADPEYVDRIIAEGAEKARKIAQATVEEVKEKMGLG